MIDFTPYLGDYVVLMTNDFASPDQLPGIRDEQVKVFKFKGLYVLARPVTKDDLKDEDFVQWLNSIWKHDEKNVKTFLKYKQEYEEKTKKTRRIVQTGPTQ
jgi:hypothetical protein